MKGALKGTAKDNSGMTAFDLTRYKAKLNGTDALKKLEEASQWARRVSRGI